MSPPRVEDRLQRVLARTERDRHLSEVIVRIERGDGTFCWTGSSGELDQATPFFIASATKLYTTAIVLRLVERGRLTLDARLIDLVGPELVRRLHVHRGTDSTDRITVRHLLSHTSGLPDYFLGKRSDGRSLEQTLRAGTDVAWTLDDVLATARYKGSAFPPGAPRKALYSDTNFQVLGCLVELLTGLQYAEALRQEVLAPLELHDSWLYTDPSDDRPLPLRDGANRLSIPQAMISFGPDGGVVATVSDLMRFLRGFFEGDLFDPAVLTSLKVYNRIFFPLQYGVGFARFKLPRIVSPWVAPPELLGHSGHSGAFAFHATREDVYLAGTYNNLARPDRPFRLMMQLLRALN